MMPGPERLAMEKSNAGKNRDCTAAGMAVKPPRG
jgi:hypothetical protein